MAELPLAERPYDVFLSYAHGDQGVADRVRDWLELAGLKVWKDDRNLAAGAKVATVLGQAIGECRALLVLLSTNAMASGWVEDEWGLASAHRNRVPGFRLVPARMDRCEVPAFLEATKWIELREGDLFVWADLLLALTPHAQDVHSRNPTLDVYVSCSWRGGREKKLLDLVLPRLDQSGVRLIGDSKDWSNYNDARVATLMRSCGGVVSIIPKRARTADRDGLAHFISEVRTAKRLGAPLLVIAEQGGKLPPDVEVDLRLSGERDVSDARMSALLDDEISRFFESARAHRRTGSVFLALAFSPDLRRRNEIVKHTIERVTGLRCTLGAEVEGAAVQHSIIQLIKNSVWMLVDISESAINLCIEAGVGLGADVECTFLARAPYARPPFMLRGPELHLYQDDVDLLALVHRYALAHRRRVISAAI